MRPETIAKYKKSENMRKKSEVIELASDIVRHKNRRRRYRNTSGGSSSAKEEEEEKRKKQRGVNSKTMAAAAAMATMQDVRTVPTNLLYENSFSNNLVKSHALFPCIGLLMAVGSFASRKKYLQLYRIDYIPRLRRFYIETFNPFSLQHYGYQVPMRYLRFASQKKNGATEDEHLNYTFKKFFLKRTNDCKPTAIDFDNTVGWTNVEKEALYLFHMHREEISDCLNSEELGNEEN